MQSCRFVCGTLTSVQLLLVLLGICCRSFCFSVTTANRITEFDKYIEDFQLRDEIDKDRDWEGYNYRLNIFVDNVKAIESFNSQKANTVVLGITKFTHWSQEEFESWVQTGARSLTMNSPPSSQRYSTLHEEYSNDHPATLDWTTRGAVTPVKNQGRCGDCWSFSVTGAMEGAYFIKYGKLPNSQDPSTGFSGLSEMQLTSCDMLSYGCAGGYPTSGYIYAAQNGGLTGESSYPFTAVNFSSGYVGGPNERCYQNYTNIEGTATDPTMPYFSVESTVDAFMKAIQVQPLSIQISASKNIFQFYKSGIIKNTDKFGQKLPKKDQCGDKLDHAVLLVGYGSQDGVDYWKVKNSWSDTWGLEGYVLIERSDENVCGVLSGGTYPNLLAKPAAPTQMPTTSRFPMQDRLYVLDHQLERKASIGLDFEAKFPKEVVLKSAKFSGKLFAGGSVDAVACLSTVHKQTSEVTTWALGAVSGSSSYVIHIAIQQDPPSFRTAASLIGAIVSSKPFEVPGYNIDMNCESLSQYEQTRSNPNNFTVILKYDDLKVHSLEYYVIKGEVNEINSYEIGATSTENETNEERSTFFEFCIFVVVLAYMTLHSIWFLRRFHRADENSQYVTIGLNELQWKGADALYETRENFASRQYGSYE